MAFGASKVFIYCITDALNRTSTSMDLNTDANFKAALYDNSITPDANATAANTCYNVGAWSSGHITDTGTGAPAGWPTVGRPLVSPTSTATTNVYTFDAADTVSASDTTTLAANYGCQIYDDDVTSPADQGLCFLNWGSASVTLGRFTIVWNGSGLFTVTV